jgi:Family of unknown function (DUF6535)
LVAVSVQDLRPNSQDTSAFYLKNIYRLLADPNVSRAAILATPAEPPPFSPPKSAVWVNSLWFLSLVISLTCALLATLLQQWAGRYLTITQPPRYSPHKRASIRAFFANGVEKFHLPRSVEALPALLHLSLFLFFSGLVVFLFNINHTVFSVVIWWVGLAGAAYGFFTVMPIFRHDSPYYAPLSSSVWFFYTGIAYSALQVFRLLERRYPRTFRSYFIHSIAYGRLFVVGLTKSVQETGSKLTAKMNNRVLTWTIQALDEDKEFERFFVALPGFCDSQVIDDLELAFAELDQTLAGVIGGFLQRTLSSTFVFEEEKERRLIICVKAADAAHLPSATAIILSTIFVRRIDVVLQSIETGHYLRNSGDRDTGLCAQGVIAGIIASVPERDDRWTALAMDQLGVSEDVLRDYLAHGDSVLLANLIHITRQFSSCLRDKRDVAYSLIYILSRISKFDIENTLPELQHEFCALWNEITREAHNCQTYHIPFFILRPIRLLYIALHRGTEAAPTAFDDSTTISDADALCEPSSYPLCNIRAHHFSEATHPFTITSPPPKPEHGHNSSYQC